MLTRSLAAMALTLALLAPVFLSRQYVRDVVTERALAYGVPPEYLLKVAQCESNFVYNARGDYGHSYGVFQLNDRGLLPEFYREGGSSPYNVYEAATFTARQFRLGNARAWSCS